MLRIAVARPETPEAQIRKETRAAMRRRTKIILAVIGFAII
jgi:hypothetical protein